MNDLPDYGRCRRAGFSIIELNENFTKRAVWAHEVEEYLKLRGLEEETGPIWREGCVPSETVPRTTTPEK